MATQAPDPGIPTSPTPDPAAGTPAPGPGDQTEVNAKIAALVARQDLLDRKATRAGTWSTTVVTTVIAGIAGAIGGLLGAWGTYQQVQTTNTTARDTNIRSWHELAEKYVTQDTYQNYPAVRCWGMLVLNHYLSETPITARAAYEFLSAGVPNPQGPSRPQTPPSGLANAPNPAAPDPPTDDSLSATFEKLMPQPNTGSTRSDRVNYLQNRGLFALSQNNIPLALEYYDRAYTEWPEYRTVDELRRALRTRPAETVTEIFSGKYDLRGISSFVIEQLRKRESTNDAQAVKAQSIDLNDDALVEKLTQACGKIGSFEAALSK